MGEEIELTLLRFERHTKTEINISGRTLFDGLAPRAYVEKDGGCNHMTCSTRGKGCGYEFCWTCGGRHLQNDCGSWVCHGIDVRPQPRYNMGYDINTGRDRRDELRRIRERAARHWPMS